MSTLIEQAAERLQQLRQAGVAISDNAVASGKEPRLAASGAVQIVGMASRNSLPAGPVAPTSKKVELDLDALAAAGIVTPHAPRSRVADQYRVIKRPLIRNARAKDALSVAHGNLIMVTSALAGEGKTFTSLNLAMSIAAEMDHTVMLVDADVARPSVLNVLGLPPTRGLLDVLESSASISDVLLRTNIDKFTILPSGKPHPRATELLASEAMRLFLDDIATRYSDRIVIFDSPPLLLTTESRVLATHIGQIVVVVRAGKTLQSVVQQALSTIDNCPIRLMLLNQVRSGDKEAYAYGYGYGYGPAGGDRQGVQGNPSA